LVVLSLLTLVASFVSVILTPASTAPLESATRPRMRPPVPWAEMSVEQIRHRLRTELKEISQQDIRDAFDDGCFDDGMEQILQISGANLLDPNQLARNTNLAIIAQG
jgi:hypothetical protein